MPLICLDSFSIAGGLDRYWQAWLRNDPALLPRFQTCEQLRRAAEALLPSTSGKTPLLLATTKGDIDAEVAWLRAIDQNTDATAAPTLGAEAARFAPTAPALALSTACSSGLVALIEAATLVSGGEAEELRVLAIDHAGDFVRDGFQSLKALAPTACRPFDRHREGLTLGSAAALCRLSTAGRGPILLSGWGISSDAVHLTAPDRHAAGLLRAIRQALDRAHLAPADIDAIVAHGTGTRYNDAMEAAAFEQLFSGPRRPAITALKGLIGHTLGASGVVEALLAGQMLLTQTIPPITGLQNPEYPRLDLVTSARNTPLRHILKVASGFGGLNAAIILSRASTVPAAPPPSMPAKGIVITRAAAADATGILSIPDAPISADPLSPDPLAATALRLAGGLLNPLTPEERRATGLILGTTLGCLAADLAFDRSRREAGGRYASPAAFTRTLPSTIAAELSIKLQLQGPLLTLSAGDASAALALHRAVAWMNQFHLDYCLAGGLDQTDPARPELLQIALFLLARAPRTGALFTLQPRPLFADAAFDPAAPADRSLAQLIAFLRAFHTSLTLPGITLQRLPSPPPRPSADR